MSTEWQPPGEDWQPPKDPEKYAEWLEQFPPGLPEMMMKEGATPAQLEEMRRAREEYRADLFATAQQAVAELRGRLRAVCPEARWPSVFKEGFARVPIMPEPERTEMVKVLGQWVEGVERAYGGELRPVLTWKYFEEGIDLNATIPKPCEMTTIYYRLKGRAAWQFLIRNTGTLKPLYTTEEYLETAEKKLWPGRTLEFVAVGWFEEAAFGFPTEPVAVPVLPAKAARQV